MIAKFSDRRTKIVATIGPASDSPEQIEALLNAGVDVFRLGLAHDDIQVVLDRVAVIREVTTRLDSPAAVLVDLPGPKVRAGTFGEDGVALIEGSEVALVAGNERSTASVINVSLPDLTSTVQIGDMLNLGDGRAVLQVSRVTHDEAIALVLHGGVMKGRPGVHIPSDRVNIPTPTPEDLIALDAAVDAGVDMVAVSFVRGARDIRALGLEKSPKGPFVVAKIETQAAVDNLETILEASDAIMVARGDLGLECSLAQLPGLQKRIIEASVLAGRPVITATQMLESMTDMPQPTRAEVSDVANAVHDGTTAVMLSGETAIGHNPVRVITVMNEILHEAEKTFDHEAWARRMELRAERNPSDRSGRITDAVSAAASRAIASLAPDSIVCITGSGNTVRAITRYRPDVTVYAVTDNARTYRQLNIVWGAVPILGSNPGEGTGRIETVLRELTRRNYLTAGQVVPVIAGSSDTSIASNVLSVHEIDPAD